MSVDSEDLDELIAILESVEPSALSAAIEAAAEVKNEFARKRRFIEEITKNVIVEESDDSWDDELDDDDDDDDDDDGWPQSSYHNGEDDED